jgi:hypothetical protein
MGVVSLEDGKTGQGGVKSDLKSANPRPDRHLDLMFESKQPIKEPGFSAAC